ncbi:hypothetical protein A2U01_0077815, partial [Trifolium medium]|nr:hypothetical protein [Trifolium medium]
PDNNEEELVDRPPANFDRPPTNFAGIWLIFAILLLLTAYFWYQMELVIAARYRAARSHSDG